MFFCFFFRLKSRISITAKPTNMKICMFFFLACALSGYIFVNPFTCVTDRYQHKQCIIMETETETNMKICMYKDFIGCVCNMLYFC